MWGSKSSPQTSSNEVRFRTVVSFIPLDPASFIDKLQNRDLKLGLPDESQLSTDLPRLLEHIVSNILIQVRRGRDALDELSKLHPQLTKTQHHV